MARGCATIISSITPTGPIVRLVGSHIDLILVGDSLAKTVYSMTAGRGRDQACGPIGSPLFPR
jgi:hypothetical protein